MWFTCPKNFKSGRLISNKFSFGDLALLVIGIVVSFVLEAILLIYFLQKNMLFNLILFLVFSLPGLLCFALIQPNGVYHNFLCFIHLLIIYMRSTKNYIWGGLLRYGDVQEITETD